MRGRAAPPGLSRRLLPRPALPRRRAHGRRPPRRPRHADQPLGGSGAPRGDTRRRASLIDALVPSKRQSPPGTRFHRAKIHPRDRTDRKGIPVTTVDRLIVDLTDVVTIPHEITAVIHEAAHQGLFSLLATLDAIERNPGRKTSLRARGDRPLRGRLGRHQERRRSPNRRPLRRPRPPAPAREHQAPRRGGRLPLAGPQARHRTRRLRPRPRPHPPRRRAPRPPPPRRRLGTSSASASRTRSFSASWPSPCSACPSSPAASSS